MESDMTGFFYTFKQFMEIIDDELKQNRNSSIVTIADNGRLASQATIARWVNASLGELSAMNPAMWYREYQYVVPTASNRIKIPFYWKELHSIFVNEYPKLIGLRTDTNAEIYSENGCEIIYKSGQFITSDTVILTGIFRPRQLPTEGIATDLSEAVDIDPDYINTLKLEVLIKYSAQNNIPNPLWYGQLRDSRVIFKDAVPVVKRNSTFTNPVVWGVGF